MKLDEVSDDVPGQTVRAMDVLFPGIGEIIGGSQREDNYEKLAQRCQEVGIPIESIWWYLETRQFGTAPHAGFGIGFERLVMFVTGMTNIRDVIPFPRTPKTAEFQEIVSHYTYICYQKIRYILYATEITDFIGCVDV